MTTEDRNRALMLDILSVKWRNMLCDNAPACPRCKSTQVQLRDYLTGPVRWKCRDCRFEWEDDRGLKRPY